MISSDLELALINLRAGSAQDLDRVMLVMHSAFDPIFGEAWTREQCAGILPLSGVTLTIAEDKNELPVGFSLYRTITDEAELLLLAVAPPARGQGIGRMLLDRFASDSFKGGAHQVHLEVRENNPALLMYQAAGFRMVGRRKNYYYGRDGRGFDALTFRKELDGSKPDNL